MYDEREVLDLFQSQLVPQLRDGVGPETEVLPVGQRAELHLLGLGVCLDGDLAVVVGEELVDFGCFLQLPHLVQKCPPPFGESKVEVELYLPVLSRLDGVHHGVEGGAGPEVGHPEDEPSGRTATGGDVLGGDLDAQLHLDEVLEVDDEAGALLL